MKTGPNVRNNGVNLLTDAMKSNGYRLCESVVDKLTLFSPSTKAVMPSPNAHLSMTALSTIVLLIMAQSSLLLGQSSQPSDQPSPLRSQSAIEKMIEDLGDDDFLVRQRSSEALLEVGSEAIPQLKKAQASVDQEVKYRANDILKQLLETDLEERSNRFLALPSTSKDDCGFHHWPTFSRLAGTSSEARSLLAEIYGNPQSEKLLAGITLAPNPSDNDFAEAKPKLFNDRSVTPSVAAYAAEMYRRSMQPPTAAGDQNSRLSGSGILEEFAASEFESNFLSLSPITVQQSAHKQAFLKLLSAWLRFELQSTPMTFAKLKIISAYRLSSFADDLCEAINQPQYPHKQAAIEALGKAFSPAEEDDQSLSADGSSMHNAISQLKPFTLSNEVLTRLPQAKTTGPVDVTLGDFAFQLILNAQGKDPKDFGMSEANGRMRLDNTTSVFCFRNRDAARQSIDQWLAKFDDSKSNIDQ